MGAPVLHKPGAPMCVDETCALIKMKSNNQHTDQEANMREWCEERSLSLHHKEHRPRGRFRDPMTAMLSATGELR
jgi:hypothetical protein